jgi:hypothetical protein
MQDGEMRELGEMSAEFQARVEADMQRKGYDRMPRVDGEGGFEYVDLSSLNFEVDEQGIVFGYDEAGELTVIGVSNTKLAEVQLFNNLTQEACERLGNFTWHTVRTYEGGVIPIRMGGQGNPEWDRDPNMKGTTAKRLDLIAHTYMSDYEEAQEFSLNLASFLINFTDQEKVKDSWPEGWGDKDLISGEDIAAVIAEGGEVWIDLGGRRGVWQVSQGISYLWQGHERFAAATADDNRVFGRCGRGSCCW